jgi:hypothetical protein
VPATGEAIPVLGRNLHVTGEAVPVVFELTNLFL